MYSPFYGFSEKPFDITPDPRFLYMSHSHREVLSSLIYGIKERRGFIEVLGEAGTGKTTLLRSALDHLKEDVRVAYIYNTDVNFSEMLQMVLADLGLASLTEQLTKVEGFDRLNNLAIQQLASGGNVVIMVDEAQNLDRTCLENLRLLSNLETRKHKLIQIVLSGQPELDEKLRRTDLRQLTQRINLRRCIQPLGEQETYAYIEQRLKVVRYSGPPLFTKKAKRLLWRASEGIPRIINTLCDNALLIAFGLKERRIHQQIVKEAIDDLGRDRYLIGAESPPPGSPGPATLPKAEPSGRRAGVFLLLFICCMTLLAAAGYEMLGSGWKAKDGLTPQNTVRVAISRHQEETPGVPASPSQEVPSISPALENTPAAGLTSTSPSHGLLQEQMEPSPAEEPNETKAGGAAPSGQLREEVTSVSARNGDSLYTIIFRYYGRFNKALEQKVLEANPSIKDPNRISVNQRIRMPELLKMEHKPEIR